MKRIQQTQTDRDRYPERERERLGLRAAIIAAVASFFIVRLCLHCVATALNTAGVMAVEQASSSENSSATIGAAEAAESALATLGVVVPLSLILPFAGWNVARRTGVAVPVVRCAVLTAIGVWLLSLSFLRFGLGSLLAS